MDRIQIKALLVAGVKAETLVEALSAAERLKVRRRIEGQVFMARDRVEDSDGLDSEVSQLRREMDQ